MATTNSTTTHCVYRIICIPSGKCYVGQTSNFSNRKRNHFNQLKRNSHHSNALQKAFNNFGADVFCAEIIEQNIPQHLINEREIYWIAHFNSYLNGYNQTIGGALPLHKYPKKKAMSVRFSLEDKRLIATLNQKLGTNQTSLIELAIRVLAEKEKVR